MAHPDVVEAIKARIGTPFNGADVIGMNLEGEVPAMGGAFIQIQYPVGTGPRRLGIGDRKYIEEGAARFVVNVERGAGQDIGIELAHQVSGLFRDQTFDGVHCLVPTEPFMDDASDQGKYFTISVVVPYWFQFTG